MTKNEKGNRKDRIIRKRDDQLMGRPSGQLVLPAGMLVLDKEVTMAA